MPVISRFFGIAIILYWEDREPPHFKAQYMGQEVVLSIDKGEVLAGSLPPRALAMVQEWRELHAHNLIMDWDLAKTHKMLHYIKPLD